MKYVLESWNPIKEVGEYLYFDVESIACFDSIRKANFYMKSTHPDAKKVDVTDHTSGEVAGWTTGERDFYLRKVPMNPTGNKNGGTT